MLRFRSRSALRVVLFLSACALPACSGCDKIKAMLGKGGDAGIDGSALDEDSGAGTTTDDTTGTTDSGTKTTTKVVTVKKDAGAGDAAAAGDAGTAPATDGGAATDAGGGGAAADAGGGGAKLGLPPTGTFTGNMVEHTTYTIVVNLPNEKAGTFQYGGPYNCKGTLTNTSHNAAMNAWNYKAQVTDQGTLKKCLASFTVQMSENKNGTWHYVEAGSARGDLTKR